MSHNLTGDAFTTGLGTLFNQAPPFPGGSLSSNGLAFTLPEKNLKTGSAQHYVLSVEKQFGTDWVVAGAYVRTRGLHLTTFSSPNAGLISTPVLYAPGAGGAALSVFSLPPTIPFTEPHRPQTDLGAFTIFRNSATSDYHSLQLSLEQQLRRGLQYRAGWTWSHAIDEVSDPFDGRGYFALPQNSTRLDLEKASANFDVRYRMTGLIAWELPEFGANPFLHAWNLAAVVEAQTGQPFSVNTAVDRNRDGNLTDRLDSLTGLTTHPGSAHPIRLSGSAPLLSLIAARGQEGRIGRNTFRSDGMNSIDVAVWRRFKISERATIDLRVEAFNCFNRTSFGIPVRILESPGFGRAYDAQSNPRLIKLMAKIYY